ncbi:Thioredoxin-like protein AAED1 [Tolypocladium ophioglossoides CBS 100239]|uniref:Thioredoxin-like protein AAED1 n=1 Tax=Tolypocladium ophioglossoides (strain CBS 100239) TaxID=1163406 RepID=A0A0L0MWP3_TOLOC|nr:Thioredoxin-like protein AAED1 [Tolypocladium ophioglossoides CBS 100239]
MADLKAEPAALAATPQEPVTATPIPASTSASEPKEAQQQEGDTKEQAASMKGSRTPPKAMYIDKTQPQDFDGELATTDELPSLEMLSKIENNIVLDRDGKTHTFQSLYSGRNVARRVLVLFVRHFFCGNCQEYLRSVSESITPNALLRLPVSTFVVVIGCGDPALIDMYVEATGCPFPVYTDPTRSLFDELGMVKTLALGSAPAYMKKSMTKSIIDSIGQVLRFAPSGLALKSGDKRQVGGEFLFEPLDVVTPITTPRDEQHKTGSLDHPDHGGHEDRGPIEVKRVTWCHRMRTTRDHAEIPEMMEILGLDGQGEPIKDKKRWSKAVQMRKGTGLSLANQMSELREADAKAS